MTRKLCITIDLEADYAGLVPESYEAVEVDKLNDYFSLIEKHRVKLSIFAVGRLLEKRLPIVERLLSAKAEFHLHTYTHSLTTLNTLEEIQKGKAAFREYFGRDPDGYRAPQGRIEQSELADLSREGFEFDTSVFPSFWPNRKYMQYPRHPYIDEETNLLELPLATFPFRLIISQSWIKLLGWAFFSVALRSFPLPKHFIYDTHFHDFVTPESAYRNLDRKWQLVLRRNNASSLALFENFLSLMTGKGYEFAYVSEVAQDARENAPSWRAAEDSKLNRRQQS